MSDRIAVIIPCFNEGNTISKVVNDWKIALPDATIYVYDNNSKDDTITEAVTSGAIVRKERHQGKGNVVRRMFREIDADCYIMIDGDDTYPAEYGTVMVKEVLENQADMVIGDRLSSTYFTENKRPFHNFGNKLVRHAINHLFDSDIKDIMTGYRAFSYDFVKTFPVLSRGFEIETEMTIHALDKNMQVSSIPVQYRDRPEGSISKLSTIPDGIKVLKTILGLYKNYQPLRFFGWNAIVLAILAIGFVIPVFVEYFKTGLVQRFPTLIVCGFFMIASLMSLFSGLILQNLVKSEQRRFELYRQIIRRNFEQRKGVSKASDFD